MANHSGSVGPDQRYRRDRSCPICGGWDTQARGRGQRCWGFVLEDGTAAVCMQRPSDRPLAGGWLHPLSNGPAPITAQPSVIKTRRWQIHDVVTGEAAAEHRRYDLSDGTKNYAWYRHGKKGLGGLPEASLPLYQADKVLRTTTPGEVVVVAEGELATDALWSLGIPAVGTVIGAPKVPDFEAFAPLVEKFALIMWPDNDDVGRELSHRIQQLLAERNIALGIIDWSDAPPKGDAANFVAQGGTSEEARQLIAVAAARVLPSHDSNTDRLEGAEVLQEVYDFLGRFVAYPSDHAHAAHTLWVAHAHLMDAWESTPRIAFLSPEPSSGKTRALEVSELLVPRPVEAVNVTPAYLFRKVGSLFGPPTILYDEIDTVFGPKAKENEEIRGLLNAGHRRGAVAGRCVMKGKTVETEEIPAYCAVALAGLGGLPDTILTRSVNIHMRRRAPSEHVEPFRRRSHAPEGHAIGAKVGRWAIEVLQQAREARPQMPEGVVDRDADVWEPLLAVADLAGGDWPKRARAAAVALVADAKQNTPSLGIRLLADLRGVFGDQAQLATEDILKNLCALEEAPWSDLKGKLLTARGLAGFLNNYGVSSLTVRLPDGRTPKGYRRQDLWDAWQRYLPVEKLATSSDDPASPPQTPQTPQPSQSELGTQGNGRILGATRNATRDAQSATSATPGAAAELEVAHVADVADSWRNGVTIASDAQVDDQDVLFEEGVEP